MWYSKAKTEIPIRSNLDRKKYYIPVNACEIAAIKTPVNEYSEEIVVPEMHINCLYFPERLTITRHGFA